jgi:hypothetical protein
MALWQRRYAALSPNPNPRGDLSMGFLTWNKHEIGVKQLLNT